MYNVVVHTALAMLMMPVATAHLVLNCPYTMQKQPVSGFHLPLQPVLHSLMV
jgi:hypothetical protein